MTVLKTAPEGADVLDLDAARAARVEARAGKPGPVIKLSAGFVELKAEVDLLVVEDITAGKIRAALTGLLADPEDAQELLKQGITSADLESIIELVTGKSLGE